jgi:hypothetical protein
MIILEEPLKSWLLFCFNTNGTIHFKGSFNLKIFDMISTYLLAALYFIFSAQISNADFSTKTDVFLKTFVQDGKVHYNKIKANPKQLGELVKMIEEMNVTTLKGDDYATFYLNAYNVLVINSVIKNYPVESPLLIKGFFDVTLQKVGGELITLNDIENKKIRAKMKDARIHFALVCAAKSCPPLTNEAFTAANVEDKLASLTKIALNSDFIKVDYANKKVEISKIFEWYQPDFGSNINESIDFINQYRTKKIPADFKKGYYEYNWDLNDF